MLLFAPSLAFLDLETTGTAAARDRVTEVGIVRVDEDGGAGSLRGSLRKKRQAGRGARGGKRTQTQRLRG